MLEHNNVTGHYLLWDKAKVETHIITNVGLFTKDFTLTTSTGTVGLKF